jgi:heme A synthase
LVPTAASIKEERMSGLSTFAKYAWFVLGYNIFVILWGAFVRASGSGAGCGSHWPLCNGVVIPHAAQAETIIEFFHRLTSGLALLLVAGLVIWAFRAYPRSHIVRKGVVFSMIFILTEALVGAGLVLFEWVAHDASAGRVISMAVHLVNTFLLLAALTLTAYWASGGKQPVIKGQGLAGWGLGLGFLGVLVLGVSGAVNALGDTLFPAASLAQGIQQDFSPAAHWLLRLRVWHPVLAITLGFYLIFVSALLALFRPERALRRFAIGLSVLFVFQLLAGMVNVLLLAPVPMQLIHLFLADAVWITLVLLAATTFQPTEVQVPVEDRHSPAFPKTAV